MSDRAGLVEMACAEPELEWLHNPAPRRYPTLEALDDDGDFWRGLIWGVALVSPFWAAVVWWAL